MENVLDKQNMEAVKELTNTSMKISEAKNLLFKLQEEETEYLVLREDKALAKIQKVLENSQDLIDKTHKNYESVHEFCKTVADYAEFLEKAHEKFQDLLTMFEKRNEIWNENIRLQDEELSRQKSIIKKDTDSIKVREKRIEESTRELKKEREHIESQQATLLVSYQAEKELWNKIHKI